MPWRGESTEPSTTYAVKTDSRSAIAADLQADSLADLAAYAFQYDPVAAAEVERQVDALTVGESDLASDNTNRIVVTVPGVTLADAQRLIGRSGSQSAFIMPPDDPRSISSPYTATEVETLRVGGFTFAPWSWEAVLGKLLAALILVGLLLCLEHVRRRDWSAVRGDVGE